VYKWILINAKQQTGKTGQKRAEGPEWPVVPSTKKKK